MIIEIPQFLKDLDWYFYEKCKCGGTMKYKYRKKGTNYEVQFMPTYSSYNLLNGGKTIINHGSINQLKQRMESI